MKCFSKIKITALVIGTVLVIGATGCGKNEAIATVSKESIEEVEGVEQQREDADNDAVTEEIRSNPENGTNAVTEEIVFDFPDNFMEERAHKYEFDSYDEIISHLNDGEAYGYAKVMGMDDEVLFITDSTFDGYGAPASIECYPYYKGDNGKYICGGIIASASTGTPISVTDDGLILAASHSDISLLAFAEETKGIMAVQYLYVEWSNEGIGTYGGFVRESNSLSAEQINVEPDSNKEFEAAFELFNTSNPIAFTVIGQGEAIAEAE